MNGALLGGSLPVWAWRNGDPQPLAATVRMVVTIWIDIVCGYGKPLIMGIRDLPTRRQLKLAFHLNPNHSEERTCLRPMPSRPISSPN